MVKVESDTKKDVKSRAKEAVVNEDGTLTLVMGKKGQRYPTESPGSGDYVFYDTLYKENPESAMALVWCIEHGVFSKEVAKQLHSKYLKAKEVYTQRNKTGARGSASSGPAPKKKRKLKQAREVAVDAGMSIAVSEGVGSMNFA